MPEYGVFCTDIPVFIVDFVCTAEKCKPQKGVKIENETALKLEIKLIQLKSSYGKTDLYVGSA